MSASMQNGPSLCMYMCNQCQWSLCVCVYILYVSDLHSGTDTFINVFVPTSSAKPCPDAYLHACIPTCLHAYIHTYIHTYTHTHIHTYTHMYLHPSLNPSHHAYMHAWSLIIVNLSLTHVLTHLLAYLFTSTCIDKHPFKLRWLFRFFKVLLFANPLIK